MTVSMQRDRDPGSKGGQPSRRLRTVLLMGAVLGILHLLVAAPHFVARLMRGSPIESFAGIESFAPVTGSIWRGAAPNPEGYVALADSGVSTVVDLRAESNATSARRLTADAGMQWVHVPIRDGQTPTATQLAQVVEVIDEAPGPVFIHCQAGVGRTGSVVAALQVGEGHSPSGELIEALRFGPLSLEQQVFILRSGTDRSVVASLPITAASRIIDSPRRLWSQLTG